MKAQPGPMVSGRYFFPKAPVLWVKRMPPDSVMSRKVIWEFWAEEIGLKKSKMNKSGSTHKRVRALAPARKFTGLLLNQPTFSTHLILTLEPVAARRHARESAAAHYCLPDATADRVR